MNEILSTSPFKIPTLANCFSICKNSSAFDYIQEDLDGHIMTVFNYKFASFNDFNNTPYSRNLRGITFMDDKLICLPLFKFFNHHECLEYFNNTINNNSIVNIADKVDGSLIMFFMMNNKLYFKTRKNFNFEHSLAIKIHLDNNPEKKEFIINSIKNGYTPNFEWISPDNRIVILYPMSNLIFLGNRSLTDGHMDYEYPLKDSAKLNINTFKNIEEILKYIEDSQDDKEGFVITYQNGEMFKLKTLRYIKRHIFRMSITKESVAESYFDNETDLLFQEIHDDVNEVNFWKGFLEYIKVISDDIINSVNFFYNINKEKIRKDYAILGQQKLGSIGFVLAMKMYTTGEFDNKLFRDLFIKHKLYEHI